VAVKLTVESFARFAEQVLPQLMPAGVETTVPVPVPVLATESTMVAAVVAAVKLAEQVDGAPRTICVVEAEPAQLPDQPEKVEPVAGTAVMVTAVLSGNATAQMVPQEIPAGLDVTTPLPVPASVTFRLAVVAGGGVVAATTAAKVAVQLAFSDSVPVKLVDVPEQCPDQPLNVEPLAGVAASVMLVLTG